MNYTKGGFPVWDEDFDREHFTPEEIVESDIQAELIMDERYLVEEERTNEAQDDAFCNRLSAEYDALPENEKNETISIEEAIKEAGLTLAWLHREKER